MRNTTNDILHTHAKYAGQCPNCTAKIRVGDKVYKMDTDAKWICESCMSVKKMEPAGTEPKPDAPPPRVHLLNRPQIRVFLQMMGLGYTKHQKTVGGLQKQAKEVTEAHPERANEVYDIIKNGARPSGAKVVVEESKLDVEKLAVEIKGKLGFTLAHVDTSIQAAVKDACADLFRTEADSHKKLEIKIGKSPAVKMKYKLPPQFERILKLAAIRQNILMIGPSGSGKTFLAARLAEALKLKYYMQSCSAGISESQLTGWLLPTKAGGAFEYVASGFVEAYENGGVFLLDEIDAADAQILMIINAALANHTMSVAQRTKNPMVKRHKDFICIAAANTMGHGEDEIYAGREILDGATLDRFRAGIVFIDYDDGVEESLVDTEVLIWGRQIRAAIKEHRLHHIMSTRVMVDFTTQKKQLGLERKDWDESYFLDWTPDERRYCNAS